MMIWSQAPLRISFCGGGTDVSPYMEERGGVVLSATINRYASARIRPRRRPGITVRSHDYDTVVRYPANGDLQDDGQLDLVKAVLRHYPAGREQGLDLVLESDAPPGSGLGSSSALVVALIGGLREWQGRPIESDAVARLAYRIERQELGIPGGMQDQYAATFGGVNLIEFGSDAVKVTPLGLDDSLLAALQARLLLCYTGRTRISANIIRSQVDAYLRRDTDAVGAMEELKRLTLAMKGALLEGRLTDFGRLLHEAWVNKKRMACQISDEGIDRLYEAGRRSGALGGKILGAGGGGYLLFYCEPEVRGCCVDALSHLGGQIADFAFDPHGLRTAIRRSGQRRTADVTPSGWPPPFHPEPGPPLRGGAPQSPEPGAKRP
jgi:D-glycero-alpha-D-manno-heptose-7-phosphate kinase